MPLASEVHEAIFDPTKIVKFKRSNLDDSGFWKGSSKTEVEILPDSDLAAFIAGNITSGTTLLSITIEEDLEKIAKRKFNEELLKICKSIKKMTSLSKDFTWEGDIELAVQFLTESGFDKENPTKEDIIEYCDSLCDTAIAQLEQELF